MEIRRRGLMMVLSSPSGAGKTTISRMLMERDSNLRMSISVTTRARRPQEEHGRDYFFIDPPAFERMVGDETHERRGAWQAPAGMTQSADRI